MPDEIRITPEQLREIADQINTHASQIEQQVTEISRAVDLMLHGGYFKGHLSSQWSTRYNQTRDTMETWPRYFNQFADILRTAADRFTREDHEQQGPMYKVPPDGNDPANMSDEALSERVTQLRESLRTSWETIGDQIKSLGWEGATIASSAILTALTGGGALPVAASIGATLGVDLLKALADLPELQATVQTLSTDSQEYMELAGIQAERTMHFSFDTPQELDQQRQIWQTMLDDRVNSRWEILQSFTGTNASLGEQLVNGLLLPFMRPVSMAMTFDTYWDTWVSNEMQIYRVQAQLNALDIRAQQIQ